MTTNVLIVDDSMTVRAIIEGILGRDPDMRVVGSASDVETARSLIKSSAPSIIILDLAMPGIDGMAFLNELARGPHAPVLVLSSLTKAGSDARAAALARGARACFDKAMLVSHADDFRRAVQKSMRAIRPSPGREPVQLAG